MRILAIADEVAEAMYGPALAELRPDVVVSCGDLPFDYLEYIVTVLSVPLVYVPGNHDPEVARRPPPPDLDASGVLLQLQPEADPPGPLGCSNADGGVVDAAGLGVAGLGGSVRYRQGPNQYTQAEMSRRAARLARRARGLLGRRGPIDVLLTHAPPRSLGDDDDPPHHGFEAFHRLVERTSPELLVHGHVHPHGRPRPDRRMGRTRVVNAVPYRLLEVRP